MYQLLITSFLFFFSALQAATLPPKISLSIPQESAVEGRDIPLYITVVHAPRDTIDENSFMLEGMAYKVVSIQKERVAPEELFKGDEKDAIQVSRFRGMLPAKKPGLYTIGPVSVLINAIRYDSGSISLNVQGAVSSPVLRVEIKPFGESKIFPGQEITFEYRIYYQRPIKLTREELPLLRMNGFLNIGSPVVTTQETADGGAQTIVQRVRAQQPGTFRVKESVIEGFEVDTSGGESRIIPPLYRASVEGSELVVRPFPEEGRPPTYDGALGSYAWRVSSLDGTSVKVGQPVRIEYRVSGRGDLSSVRFPLLSQIVGLQDAFWTEALPPVGEEIDGTKRFTLVVRPKKTGSVEVPGFFVYSFDPVSEKYLTVAVSPVSLKVEGSKEAEVVPFGKESSLDGAFVPLHELTPATAQMQDVSVSFVVSLIVALVVIGIVEYFIKKFLQKEKQTITSQKLFYEAVSTRSEGYESLKRLRMAFYRRLFEVGATKVIEEGPVHLADEGLVGEVKGFLKTLDEVLYRRDVPPEGVTSLFEEAKGLYQKLKRLPTIH